MASGSTASGASRLQRARGWVKDTTLGKVFAIALVTALGTAAATALIQVLTPDADPYEVELESNPDRIETRTGVVGGSYIVDSPIEDVGSPPNEANACDGRYLWAQDMEGIDADSTTFRVTVRGTRNEAVRITGMEPELLEEESPAVGSHLTCPGRGEAPVTRSVSFPLEEDPDVTLTDESGQVIPFVFDVRAGQDETFDVTALAEDCNCTWRLVVHLVVDGEEVSYVHPQTFRTSSSSNALSYYFDEDRWVQQGEDPQPPGPAPPAPPSPCDFVPLDRAVGALRQPLLQTALPPQTSPGVSARALTTSLCTYQGDPSGQAGVPADGITLTLDRTNSAAEAEEELLARIALYEPPLVAVALPGADAAYAAGGVVAVRVDSGLATVAVIGDADLADAVARSLVDDLIQAL